MCAKIECHHGNLMKNIIILDIFGRTAALECLSTEISQDALSLDPYDSEYMGFENEKAATYLEHKSFAFTGALRCAHDALRFCFPSLQPRRSKFDATNLRDFMTLQSQFKRSFPASSKPIYAHIVLERR